jgi:hypothetical protein
VIEPLTRARPPIVRGVSGTPVAYVYRDVLSEILFNGTYAPEQLAGGLLVGSHFQCPETGRAYVEVEGFVAGTHVENLAELLRNFRVQWKTAGLALRYNFPGAELVGWYAAFPQTVEGPGQDALVLHQTFFTHPWQIGLWVPPEADAAQALATATSPGATGPRLEAHPVGVIHAAAARAR